jgi:hypothetical protein
MISSAILRLEAWVLGVTWTGIGKSKFLLGDITMGGGDPISSSGVLRTSFLLAVVS